MHEMGIASSVIQAVRDAGAKHAAHVQRVGLTIGKLAAVDPESLRFCFDALVCGTDLEPLGLEITDGELDELNITYVELEE